MASIIYPCQTLVEPRYWLRNAFCLHSGSLILWSSINFFWGRREVGSWREEQVLNSERSTVPSEVVILSSSRLNVCWRRCHVIFMPVIRLPGEPANLRLGSWIFSQIVEGRCASWRKFSASEVRVSLRWGLSLSQRQDRKSVRTICSISDWNHNLSEHPTSSTSTMYATPVQVWPSIGLISG